MKRTIVLCIACLCGSWAAQAEPVSFGTNLQWELRNDSLFITSPAPEQDASMSFDEGVAPWADDSLTIEAIELPGNLKTIAVNAFESFKTIQEVTIPASVTHINAYAFYNCVGLKTVTCLPTDPPVLATDAFANCDPNLVICVPSLGAYKSNGWETYEGNLSLCKETPTGIDNANANANAYKLIEDNRVVIIRGGEKYDVTGKKLNK